MHKASEFLTLLSFFWCASHLIKIIQSQIAICYHNSSTSSSTQTRSRCDWWATSSTSTSQQSTSLRDQEKRIYWKTWSLDEWKSVTRWKSVAIATELFVMNLSFKSCFYSTQSKKSFLFNSCEKVVLIQLNRKSRPHSTHMRTAFSDGLNRDGFFKWVERERLFQLNWMKTIFSTVLNKNDF